MQYGCRNLNYFNCVFTVTGSLCVALIADYSVSHVSGYPSLAITFFLHEAYGEERILKVLDYFQHPPWQYHHTESCGRRTTGIHISSSRSPATATMQPYLLPSRDFYSLGAGMPVWGVRPVHCGGEILRVTLYSNHDNYEDAVRLYETVLQQQAEEQKMGFCWFTLHSGTFFQCFPLISDFFFYPKKNLISIVLVLVYRMSLHLVMLSYSTLVFFWNKKVIKQNKLTLCHQCGF